MSRVRLLLLLAAGILLAGCPAARQATIDTPCPPPAEIPDVTLTPLERYSILQGTAGEPFAMVENDGEAGDAFLRTPSQPVQPGDPVVSHLADRMAATLVREQGVGIAAVQVGIGRRVVLVERFDREGQPVQALLNPAFVDRSAATATGWEGCLSVPAGFGEVERATSVVVEYDTLDGTHEVETVEGFTAVILQHELDHLDGVLFLDHTVTEPLMPRDEYRAMREAEQEAADGG